MKKPETVLTAFRLPKTLIEKVDKVSNGNRSEYIRKAVTEKLEKKGNEMKDITTATNVINQYGKALNFAAAVNLMDDDIREQLHNELAPCTNQVFFDAYVNAHAEKFGEDWVLDDPNPVW